METLVSDSTIQILDICKLSIIPDSFAGIQSGSIIDVAPANTLKNATTVWILVFEGGGYVRYDNAVVDGW